MIDVAPLVEGGPGQADVARQIDAAARDVGFFYIRGHGVPEDLQTRLDHEARAFFALPEASKAEMAMIKGGRAWRGWFPLGGELTSGRPDGKEGYYFGAELPADHPLVRAGTPLHGPNLFPAQVPGLGPARPRAPRRHDRPRAARSCAAWPWVSASDAGWFDAHLTADPLILFRIFRYPPGPAADDASWGVAEHTDYGLLTILAPGRRGRPAGARPGGLGRRPADPGHVRVQPGRHARADDRRSLPVDPAPGAQRELTPIACRSRSSSTRRWDAEVLPVPLADEAAGQARARWDGEDVFAFDGTYGDYLLGKVGKVFPELGAEVLESSCLRDLCLTQFAQLLADAPGGSLGVALVGPARAAQHERQPVAPGRRVRRRRGRCRGTRGVAMRTGLYVSMFFVSP